MRGLGSVRGGHGLGHIPLTAAGILSKLNTVRGGEGGRVLSKLSGRRAGLVLRASSRRGTSAEFVEWRASEECVRWEGGNHC